MGQSRTPSKPTPQRSTRAPTRGGGATTNAQRAGNAAAVAPRSGGVGDTLRGWWDGATKAVGDAYDATTQAVGEAWDTTKRVAGDVSDVVGSSSVDYKDGKLSATTDMDEVMDLLPESMRAGVRLDKNDPAANRVNLEYDTKSGTLTVGVPDLQMQGLSGNGVRAGATRMSGIVVTMEGADRKAREIVQKKAGETVAGWVFGDGKKTATPQRTTMKVAKAVASDVAADGVGASARQIDLGAVDIVLEEAGQGKASAFFSVGTATVSGLQSKGGSAAEVGATNLSGAITPNREQGHLAAERLSARQLDAGGGTVGDAELRGLRAGFSNAGGGAPLLDERADTDLRANVSVAGLNASNAAAGPNRVGALSATNLSAAHAAGVTDLDADAIDASGLDTEAVDAETVALSKVHAGSGGDAPKPFVNFGAGNATGVRVNAGGVQANAATLNASGVKLSAGDEAGTANGVNATGVRVANKGSVYNANRLSAKDVAAANNRLKLGSVAADGLTTPDVSVGSVRGETIDVNAEREQMRLEAARLHATRVSGKDASVAGADVRGLSATMGGGAVGARATGVDLTGVDTRDLDAAQISAANLGVSTGGGGVSVDASRLDARGVATGGATVDAANVSRARVSRDRDGAVAASVGQLGVQGVKAGDARVAEASATNARLNLSGGRVAVGADALGVAGVDTREVDLARGQVSGLDANVDLADPRRGSGAFGSASVSGLDSRGLSAREAEVRGAAWSNDSTNASLRVDALRATRAVGQGARADSLAVNGVAARFDGASERGSVSVADASARGATVGGTTIGAVDASAVQADVVNRGGGLPGLDDKRDDLRARARVGQASASGIDGEVVDMGGARATGLTVDTTGKSPSLGVDAARVDDVAVRTGGMGLHVGSAEVANGRAAMTGPGLDASASRAKATDLAFSASYANPKGAASGASRGAGAARGAGTRGSALPEAKVDPMGLLARVDDASVRASLPLNAGDQGVAEVRPNTTANAQLEVRDGAIDPDRTRVDFTRPLDGPLWTEANGVYLERGKKPGTGRAKVDVQGWFDQDVTESLPGKPKDMPLDLDTLARSVSGSNGAGSARGGAATGSRSTGGASTGGASPGGAAGMADLSKLRMEGSASLSNGAVDLGVASGTLAGRGPTDNAASFQADGAGNLALMFARLLVSNVRIDAGGQDTKAGALSTSDAKLRLSQGKDTQRVEGSIGAVDVKDVSTTAR